MLDDVRWTAVTALHWKGMYDGMIRMAFGSKLQLHGMEFEFMALARKRLNWLFEMYLMEYITQQPLFYK